MTNEELADIGNKMLDVLDRRGWCKYRLENDRGQVCLVGAASIAVCGAVYGAWALRDKEALVRLDEAAAALGFSNRIHPPYGYGYTAAEFNNATSTSEEDVKLLIKRALIEPSLGGTE